MSLARRYGHKNYSRLAGCKTKSCHSCATAEQALKKGSSSAFSSRAIGLTIRSSRPRVAASAMCFALRSHMSATPTQGGLTPALGGRKAFGGLLFHTATFSAPVGVALRTSSRLVASSVKSVWRAQTSHALRWPASETVFGKVCFFAIHTVASVTSGVEFAGARSVVPASIFGNCSGVSLLSESTAT